MPRQAKRYCDDRSYWCSVLVFSLNFGRGPGEMKSRSGARSPVGHAVNLYFAIHNHPRCDTGTRGRMLAEVLLEDRIECGEVARIVEPDAAPHHVLRCIACFL